MDKEIFIHIGAPRTGTCYLRNNIYPYIHNVYYENKLEYTKDGLFPLVDFFSRIAHIGDGDELSDSVFKPLLPQINENKLLISEEHMIWSIFHMMGNVGSRALMLKKFCPNAKIIITIRRQPEYFISLFKYFRTLDSTHLHRQMCNIENMLNLDTHIEQMSLFFRFGVPCGAEILQKYFAYAIEHNYFDRGRRHFISADFSWYRLFEIYEELFGRENILVFPQEMTLKKPKLVLKLLSCFIGEKITPKEIFLSKRDNSTYRITTPFATKEHEELFKSYIIRLNTSSNRKLNNALQYINLEEYGYFENVIKNHIKIFVGTKTSKRLTLNHKLCKAASYARNCFRRRGTSATMSFLLGKANVLTRRKYKLVLQSVHNKLMLLMDKLYGVDFEQMLPIEDLGTKKEESKQYECTKTIEVKRVFGKIDLPVNSIAVDFGSGKGKMLCFLAKYKNVKRAYGLEISGYLVNIAIRNIAKLGIQNAEILNMNALDIPNDILDKSNLFYFYNPFPKRIFEGVFQKIELSLKRRARDVYIVYFNPVNADVIDSSSMFQKQATYSNIISFAKTTIYRSH